MSPTDSQLVSTHDTCAEAFAASHQCAAGIGGNFEEDWPCAPSSDVLARTMLTLMDHYRQNAVVLIKINKCVPR